jgi:hypothetical protein
MHNKQPQDEAGSQEGGIERGTTNAELKGTHNGHGDRDLAPQRLGVGEVVHVEDDLERRTERNNGQLKA